jgi:hypothetical protein
MQKCQNDFKNQLNMFFHMIIFYTCDLHLELEILNLINIKHYLNDLIKESFPLQFFVLKFQNFENFIYLFFSGN